MTSSHQPLAELVAAAEPYEQAVPTRAGEPYKQITIEGIYVHGDTARTWLQYSGAQAAESFAAVVIPSDPDFLRSLAVGLCRYAEQIEARRGS